METAILTGLIEITLYSAALFCGVLLFRLALSKWLSPGLRYALWFLVLLRLIVPVTFESAFHLITLPAQETPTPIVATAPPMQGLPMDGNAPQLDGGAQTAPFGEQQAPKPAAIPSPARKAWKPSWQQWLLMVWAAGVLAVASVHGILSAQLARRIRQHGYPPESGIQTLCARIGADLGVRARLPVVVLADLSSPALTAQLRPKLLLPQRLAADAPDERLAFSLLHELMHFKRRDYLVCMLLTLLSAIWWFNPVVWILPRYLRADMESACDAQAVRKLGPQQKLDYANLLLELGQRT